MTDTSTPTALSDPTAPVFVDTSGRRQRRLRRIGWTLAVPAAGYLVLVASSALGGPTLGGPLLPHAATPASSPSPAATDEPAASETPSLAEPSATGRPAAAGAAPAATPKSDAAARTTGPATQTTAPAAATASATHGRPSAAPSNTRKPTKTP